MEKPDYINVIQLPKAEHLVKILFEGKEIPFTQVRDDAVAILSIGAPIPLEDVGAFDLKFFLRFVAYDYDDYMKLELNPDHVPTPIVVMESEGESKENGK